MHGVAKAKQIFGEIGAVLPGDAGKERNAPFRMLNSHILSNKMLVRSQPPDNTLCHIGYRLHQSGRGRIPCFSDAEQLASRIEDRREPFRTCH
jgi:hypothetical protein